MVRERMLTAEIRETFVIMLIFLFVLKFFSSDAVVVDFITTINST